MEIKFFYYQNLAQMALKASIFDQNSISQITFFYPQTQKKFSDIRESIEPESQLSLSDYKTSGTRPEQLIINILERITIQIDSCIFIESLKPATLIHLRYDFSNKEFEVGLESRVFLTPVGHNLLKNLISN